MTVDFRVASKVKHNGFGIAVVQRLCKTSVKKNLYWEIKDKVIEETFDGTRNIKHSAKVKIYGLDSNQKVRARLMEILVERVKYHKDKFIAPVFHQELCGLQWKKNRIDHTDHTHDDNLFSLLMALYVWYDGKDITEKFGIHRQNIKTDEDAEIVDGDIEAAEAKKENLDLTPLERDLDDFHNDELASAYQFLEETKHFTTAGQFSEQTKIDEIIRKENFLAYNKQAREAYCKANNLDPELFVNNHVGIDNSMVTLPDSLFGGVDVDNDNSPYGGLLDDDDSPNRGWQTNISGNDHLVGNLSSYWNQL